MIVLGISLMAVYWREDILASKDGGEKRETRAKIMQATRSCHPLSFHTPMHIPLLFPTIRVSNSSNRLHPIKHTFFVTNGG